MNAALGPLRSPAFRRYLIGQLPSITCSWAQVVALSWVVVHRDPAALGLVVALQFTPSLVLGPWFGTVADRYDRKRILMLAEAGLGAVAAAYAVAAATGRLTVPVVCLLATIWGVVNALDTPARRALVPLLVPSGQAARASALTGIVLLLGMTAGSAVGAGLVAGAGVASTFAVNAGSFALDVALLSTIRAGTSPRVPRARGQLREGRVMSWFAVVLIGGTAAGGPLAGAAAGLGGPRAPFAVGALAAVAVCTALRTVTRTVHSGQSWRAAPGG